MTITEMIAALQALQTTHGGDVDVTLWMYSGGNDDLMDARPAFDPETGTVVIDQRGRHDSGAQR